MTGLFLECWYSRRRGFWGKLFWAIGITLLEKFKALYDLDLFCKVWGLDIGGGSWWKLTAGWGFGIFCCNWCWGSK